MGSEKLSLGTELGNLSRRTRVQSLAREFDIPHRCVGQIPSIVAMCFNFINKSFKGVLRYIVYCMGVHSPRHHGHKTSQRWIGARGIDICLCRCWQSNAIRIITNDPSLIGVTGDVSTAGCEYSADPVVPVCLYCS